MVRNRQNKTFPSPGGRGLRGGGIINRCLHFIFFHPHLGPPPSRGRRFEASAQRWVSFTKSPPMGAPPFRGGFFTWIWKLIAESLETLSSTSPPKAIVIIHVFSGKIYFGLQIADFETGNPPEGWESAGQFRILLHSRIATRGCSYMTSFI